MENFKEKKFLYAGFLAFFIILFSPSLINAASLYCSPSSSSYAIGSTFSVSIYVSSVDQAMNAAASVISFPQDKLEVVSLSKSDTILNLWVQEPTFSNNAGTVIFEGIVSNPGFIGSAGKIITINFKGKATGSVLLTFSSGSVLANDGKGTNILSNLIDGAYVLGQGVEEYIPLIPAGSLSASIISSLTHPEPEKWYSNNNPEFSWKIPPDVTGVSLLLDKNPTSNPGPISDGKIESKKFKDVEDGIWYFHIKFQNQYGWGGITHRKVLIDTEFPNPFEIKADNDGDPTNPSPILYFNTTDSLSGIEYYEVKIGEGNIFAFKPEEVASNPFRMPPQSPGKHTVIVKAVDKAGNSILAMAETNILPIEIPKITNWPKTITPEAAFSIKGTSSPKNLINIYLEKDGTVQKFTTKSDENGDWEYIFIIESLKEGVHYIWVEAMNEKGALSSHSEKISFLVQASTFLKIGKLTLNYLASFIVLVGLVAFIVFSTYFIWYKFKRFRNSLRKETKEAKETTFHAFNVLRKEIQKQIEYFDKKPGLTKEEKAIHEKLQEALNISEKFIGKEIKDIEKELE
jgi:hypothetical protein